jgi:hypothetical protein
MRILRDIGAVGGMLLVGSGLSMLSVPLACVVVGALLLAGSVWGHTHDDVARRDSRREKIRREPTDSTRV